MTHPSNADKPLKPGGTNSPASRKKEASKREKAEQRALNRFKVVKWY